MPGDLDIRVPRNGRYFQEWQLCDNEGEPIDITGETLTMEARLIAGAGGVVASATIVQVDTTTGSFTVDWDGADFAAVPGVTEIVRLAYDLKRDTGEIPVAGHIILMPGVTS